MAHKGNVDTCPNCLYRMQKGLAPFKFHGSYIGKFEAYLCGQCHRVYFTEKAYKDVIEIPLNPDEASDFTDEIMMPTVTVMSPMVVYEDEKISTINLKSELRDLKTFPVRITERQGLKNTNKQNDDLQVVT